MIVKNVTVVTAGHMPPAHGPFADAGVFRQDMEGDMLASICFTLVIVAMAFPGLILLAWPDVASEPEHLASEAR